MSLQSWIQDRPRPLEWAYRTTERLFHLLDAVLARVGYGRLERVILWPETVSKRALFDCRMCGQCILRQTGMTCPKLLRNGPCGGVRPGGFCEVYPDRRCIWHQAYQRSQGMHIHEEDLLLVQPAVDWRLEGTSGWVNMFTSRDRP